MTIEFSIECICDVWLDSDGKVWRTSSADGGDKSFIPVEGYESGCRFHKRHPEIFYDRDAWYERYGNAIAR